MVTAITLIRLLGGVFAWTIVASLITAGLYLWDKRAAANGRRRIPEKTLLGWSTLGGWPGGFITGRMIRHKTQKRSYRIQFSLAIVIHVLAVVSLCYFNWHKG